MKTVLRNISRSVLFAAIAFTSGSAIAQCTTWAAGVPATGWVDFNSMFEGAPCDPGTGCPVNEITAFEIYADEAYSMENIQEGGTYTFSACNGVGGTAWPISYTILNPSGEVDAFGLDDGSNCALTWTATETGTYIIVVSEAGVACGSSTNQSTDNGYPAITCTGGSAAVACPEPPPAPENDMCANAIALNVSSSCVPVDGTTDNANQEMAPATCDGETSTTAREVWYSFVANGTEQQITVQGVGTFDAIVEVFSGSCGSLTSLACRDQTFPSATTPAAEVLNYSSYVAGETYLVRVYHWNQQANATGRQFQICVVDQIVGIQELSKNEFNVFPNPTNGNITIQNESIDGNVQIELMDMTGRSVYSSNKVMVQGEQTMLALEGKLVAGSYNLVLTTEKGRAVKAVIVR